MNMRAYTVALLPGEIQMLRTIRGLPFLNDVPEHSIEDAQSLIDNGLVEECAGVLVVTGPGLHWLRLVEIT